MKNSMKPKRNAAFITAIMCITALLSTLILNTSALRADEIGSTEKTVKGEALRIDPSEWRVDLAKAGEFLAAVGKGIFQVVDLRKIGIAAQSKTSQYGQVSVYQMEIEASLFKMYGEGYGGLLTSGLKINHPSRAKKIDLNGVTGQWLPITVIAGYGDAMLDVTKKLELQKISGNIFVFNFNALPYVKSSLYLPGYKYEENIQLGSSTSQIEVVRARLNLAFDLAFGKSENNGNLRILMQAEGSWGFNNLYASDTSNGEISPLNVGEGSIAGGIQFLKTISLFAGIGGTGHSTIEIQGKHQIQLMNNAYKYLQAVISPFNFRNEDAEWKHFLNHLNVVVDWKYSNHFTLTDYAKHEAETEINAPVGMIKLQYNQ